MKVEIVEIEKIHPDPANVRLHPKKNLDAIKDSLHRFGQQKPIVVNEEDCILAGNGTYLAMKEMGRSHIAIVRTTLDGIDATAYAIADNRTSELATWDEPALAKIMRDLQREDKLHGIGFETDEVDQLLKSINAETSRMADMAIEGSAPEDAGAEEPPTEAVSRPGDLWILGEHRLLCGDSTSAADVDRIMDGEKAALVATDPPYLVDYTGKRGDLGGKDWSRDYKEIDVNDADSFFGDLFANVRRVIAPHAAIYCWHAHKRTGAIQRVWEDLGILDHQQIVWVKPAAVIGHAVYLYRHEPCMVGWVKGSKPPHDGNNKENSVWELDWDGKSRATAKDHPTEKPVEVFAIPIRKHTQKGDLCFEPFSGSGSQIIACERTGRRCRAIEISPVFVDVGVRRWERTTGREAVLEGTESTFAEIREERLREPVAEPDPEPVTS